MRSFWLSNAGDKTPLLPIVDDQQSHSCGKERTMKTYNVHIYREMRLFFPGIVARTAEEAATLAAEMPADAAEALEDCDGENLAALVGVVGSADCKQSRMI